MKVSKCDFKKKKIISFVSVFECSFSLGYTDFDTLAVLVFFSDFHYI